MQTDEFKIFNCYMLSSTTSILRRWQTSRTWKYMDIFFSRIFNIPFSEMWVEHQYYNGYIKGYEMGKSFLGMKPFFTVRLYVVGDTMIDTGLACYKEKVRAYGVAAS